MPTSKLPVDALFDAAWRARENAYAPYSGFAVGAAVLAGSGRIYPGANVENASYGLTICAEQAAIAAAVAAGERDVTAAAVVTGAVRVTPPCGACRQVLAEFGVRQVLAENQRGERRTWSMDALLPDAFTADSLRDNATGPASAE